MCGGIEWEDRWLDFRVNLAQWLGDYCPAPNAAWQACQQLKHPTVGFIFEQ
jgi:hypothetical protein